MKHCNSIPATPAAALAPTELACHSVSNAERGILIFVQTLVSISLAQACTCRAQSSFAALAQIQHGESTVASYKPRLNRPRAWKDLRSLLVSHCLPQPEQSLRIKVLPRLNLLASLGMWSIDKIKRQVVKFSTRQLRKRKENETASPTAGNLECQDHVLWPLQRPPTN